MLVLVHQHRARTRNVPPQIVAHQVVTHHSRNDTENHLDQHRKINTEDPRTPHHTPHLLEEENVNFLLNPHQEVYLQFRARSSIKDTDLRWQQET